MHRTRALSVVGALGVLLGALVHAYLWNEGYKDIPSIEGPELFKVGNLFLANAVTGVVIAVAVVALRGAVHRLALVAGVVWSLAALVAFYLSRNGGLFGFEELGWNPSPEAALSVAGEAVGLVALGAALALSVGSQAERREPATAA